MILVLGGTTESREIIAGLAAGGHAGLASVTTPYAAVLARRAGAQEVLAAGLTEASFPVALDSYGVRLVIDATHPFATRISALARECCCRQHVSYVRYARPTDPLVFGPGCYPAVGWQQAAAQAGELGEVIFLTIGTRHLDAFRFLREQGKRIVARVLPAEASLAVCWRAGLTPADVVAMQGPFSVALNRALFEAYGAQVVVTKESGRAGGLDTKLEAARQLGLPVVVIRRPPEVAAAVSSEEALWETLKEAGYSVGSGNSLESR